MTGALEGYDERGLARLLHAVEYGPPAEPDLDRAEVLEAMRCATEAWDLIVQQLGMAASWDRSALGVATDGRTTDEQELTPRQVGARQFLRLVAATLVKPQDTDALARTVHALAWGNEPSDVTWSDVRTILEGTATQPSVHVLAGIAELVREGYTQREIVQVLDVSKHQVEAVSTFLGVKQWREESKLRAAREAAAEGLSAAELARQYSADHPRANRLSERWARQLLAEVRAEQEAA